MFCPRIFCNFFFYFELRFGFVGSDHLLINESSLLFLFHYVVDSFLSFIFHALIFILNGGNPNFVGFVTELGIKLKLPIYIVKGSIWT